jgi:hypothetical protein
MSSCKAAPFHRRLVAAVFAEAWLQSQVSACEICCRQIVTRTLGQIFLREFRSSPACIIPPMLSTHLHQLVYVTRTKNG